MRSAKLMTLAALTVLICGLFSAVDAATDEKAIDLGGRVHTLGDIKSVPAQLNYQGYLIDAADSSAVSAAQEMTFRIYDAEMGGSELWSETHPAVEISDGLFHVLLGSVTSFPTDLFDGSPLWLQTEVGPEVLAPRKPLVSVAYSQRTEVADHSATAEWSTEAQHAVRADTAEYAQNAIAAVAESAAVADDAHHLQGQTPTDLDGRWVNEENLDHLNASDGNPLNALSVDATGRVGIGTISPSTELDVDGSVSATAYYGDGSHLTGIAGTPDADWTISGSDMYSGVPGNVGIGTNSPGAKLEINYNNVSPTTPAITINNSDPSGQDALDFQFAGTTKARLRVAATGGVHFGTVTVGDLNLWTNNAVRQHISNDGQVGIGTSSPTQLLDVNGNIQTGDTLFVGTPGRDGVFELYRNGSSHPMVQLKDDGDDGGMANFYEAASSGTYCSINPDGDGYGGYLYIRRNHVTAGFTVDGNYSGTEEPRVSIAGSTRSVQFKMDQTGDAAVVMPEDAISAGEIMNEPGVSNSLGMAFYFLNGGNIDYTVDTVAITIPGPGYVEVAGGCYLGLYHTNGTDTRVFVAIDKTPANASYTFPGAQVASVPGAIASSTWAFPCATTRLYEETTAGTKTYYLNVEYDSGTSANTSIARIYMRAIYYPTLYGTLTLVEDDGSGDVSANALGTADGTRPAPEPRRRSVTVEEHNARLQAEVAAIRAELEELKEAMQDQRAGD